MIEQTSYFTQVQAQFYVHVSFGYNSITHHEHTKLIIVTLKRHTNTLITVQVHTHTHKSLLKKTKF